MPDVTGEGTVAGAVTVAQLQAVTPETVVTAASINVDGIDRGYLLVTPTGLNGPLPLIVVLGGVDASPTEEAERDELLPMVMLGQAVLAYPAGYDESWNTGVDGCCSTAAFVGIDDVSFVQAVTTAVQASTPISSTYLVGFSNGGKLAYQVICDDPGLFDAVAIVGATPLAACPAQVPVPMIIMVGAKDPELPLQGHTGPPVPFFNAALTAWRGYNSCSETPTSVVGIGTAVTTTWSACTSGAPVVGVLYGGLDHEWPSADLVGDNVAGANIIWSFLLTSTARQTHQAVGDLTETLDHS